MIFGFLIFPGLEELDLVGPWEMVSSWSKYAHGPESCIMVAEKPEPVICAKGMSLNPPFNLCSLPKAGLSPGAGWRRHAQRGR
jgi:hypothetical protein